MMKLDVGCETKFDTDQYIEDTSYKSDFFLSCLKMAGQNSLIPK